MVVSITVANPTGFRGDCDSDRAGWGDQLVRGTSIAERVRDSRGVYFLSAGSVEVGFVGRRVPPESILQEEGIAGPGGPVEAGTESA